MVFAQGNGQLEYEQKHVYAGSERIEQFTDKGNWERTLYVHEDVMGNTRYYTKANGQSFAELTYDAWGMPESPNKLLNNDHGNYVFATFTGHIYDTTLDIYFAEARFYDANNRTWLAVDPVKDGGNWYQYCFSNPTTFYDPTGLAGFSPFSGCVDMNKLAEQIDWDEVNKWIQTVKAFGQCVDGTYTIGLDLSFTPKIWQFDGTIGISIDTKGNVAVQGALLVGPTTSTPALGILEYKTVTTASSVYELEGFSAQVGGSKLFPIQEGCPIWGMAGGDLVFIGNPNNGRPGAIGITSSGGIGIGEGVEFHAQMGQTTTFYSINLFDLWDGIYDKKKSR